MPATTEKPAIQSLDLTEIEAVLAERGQPKYRAQQVLRWLYEKRVTAFSEMTDLPAALRADLAEAFTFLRLESLRVLGSADTTRKYLFRLPPVVRAGGNAQRPMSDASPRSVNDAPASLDVGSSTLAVGRSDLIETVLIPASPALYGEASDRRTLCVSTQVGCAYGCKFCASGLDGFSRNLSPGEIAGQLIEAERLSGERVSNLVFMGMGEPLANFANLMRAIDIINSPWGIGLGARHITVSTSGLAPQIRQLADQPRQIRLAISLHGATDEVRSQIMPVNRKYPLAELIEACAYHTSRKKQHITFEYILIEGINDEPAHAADLARVAKLVRAKVNCIPYNKVEGLEWKRPDEARQDAFMSVLERARIPATIRREKGHDIAAACGQLRRQQIAVAG
ncbi:MAG: 23S rRNA (adenine(2503)-C(2))-methyltransferase RlmN [Verrucomicrobia bacterium]|nr:23S rRNA (adenine(2503)-C(2))-methyltransferase RlmN [Verrucomicrobiota bacterium]